MKFPKKIGRWILILIVLVLLYFALAGSEGLINLYRIHLEVRHMTEEIHELKSNIDSLQETIEKFKNDTSYIEKFARENLGMAKEGEKVYKFLEEDK
jgi:cell division protein FtsB